MLEATLAQRQRGLLSMSHSRRALCKANMCSRVMIWIGREWRGLSPRRKCSVVDTANVPHDHKGRGASRWIAILGS